jgi:CXXC-20-CXXC protein
MNKCVICNKKFTLKQKFSSNFKNKTIIVCYNCKTRYKIKIFSRILISIFSILLPGLITTKIYTYYFLDSITTILIFIILATIGMSIGTFFTRYKTIK